MHPGTRGTPTCTRCFPDDIIGRMMMKATTTSPEYMLENGIHGNTGNAPVKAVRIISAMHRVTRHTM